MKRNIIFQFFIYSIWFIPLHTNDLGEIFDCLMGKYDDPDYQAYMQNRSTAPFFANNVSSYSFARSAFEKYSIEIFKREYSLQIPKIIHQIWLGGEVPEKYAYWMSTWSEHHPDWTYILWTDADIKYLNLINKDLFDKATNYGEKSDILRLELLNTFGGLYIDTDYQCIKPLDQFHYCNTFYVSALGYGFNISNALIGCSQGHPLVQKLVENLKNSAGLENLFERTGPRYFTRTIYTNAPSSIDGIVIYPPRYFTPNQDTSHAYNHINTFAKHWFSASWKKKQEKEKKIYKDASMEHRLMHFYFQQKLNKSQSQSENINIWLDLINNLQIKTIVELGACQFLINNEILDNIQYIGISRVKFLVLDYRLTYPDENRSYLWKDWAQDVIASSDLLIIGDTLEYLPFNDCQKILKKVKSNAQFLMIAHDENAKNENMLTIQKRPLNMYQQPFNLPKAKKMININNKSYGIWKNDI